MNDATNGYISQGRTFLAQAREEFRQDDLRQASEKGWGAAAQMVKAAAVERGWEHDRHGRLYEVTRRLAQETDDPELRLQFTAAGELHANFYEGFMDRYDVDLHLGVVERFVDRVEALLLNGG